MKQRSRRHRCRCRNRNAEQVSGFKSYFGGSSERMQRLELIPPSMYQLAYCSRLTLQSSLSQSQEFNNESRRKFPSLQVLTHVVRRVGGQPTNPVQYGPRGRNLSSFKLLICLPASSAHFSTLLHALTGIFHQYFGPCALPLGVLRVPLYSVSASFGLSRRS